MKIRKKITLWITGAALFSTIAFSCLIFWEMMEQPFQLIDRELQTMADTVWEKISKTDLTISSDRFLNLPGMPYNQDAYWIMIRDDTGKILYRSHLTEFANLIIPRGKSKYLIEKHIPRSGIWLGQDRSDDVMFRVLVISKDINGRHVEIRVAKPIEGLEEELIELAFEIGISLFFCVLSIILISHALAGRILNPISAIIRKSKEINEKSLDQRIPLGKSRDELYDLTVSLNRMFDRIQHSFNQQKEFIGSASHELKSPITLLMLAQEEMLMNGQLPSSQEKSLIKQLETTRRMSHLVKNLLDLSRMEHQETLNKVYTDLAQILLKVIDDYSDVLAEKQIVVRNDLPGPCNIHGDREKLFRLFVNLIDNAIRYNREANGEILIRGEKDKAGICIEIINSGRPIPEEDFAHLFEPFYRVEKSRSHTLGGSGLGLAIANRIVGLHNGKITITNETESLVKLTVNLPLQL